MSAYLDHLGLLYKHQYGFRRGRSRAQAVGLLNNFVLDAMDGQKVTGMLFFDISKASDFIKHKILLGKLEHIGLSARSLRWFKSYLADRRHANACEALTSLQWVPLHARRFGHRN